MNVKPLPVLAGELTPRGQKGAVVSNGKRHVVQLAPMPLSNDERAPATCAFEDGCSPHFWIDQLEFWEPTRYTHTPRRDTSMAEVRESDGETGYLGL